MYFYNNRNFQNFPKKKKERRKKKLGEIRDNKLLSIRISKFRYTSPLSSHPTCNFPKRREKKGKYIYRERERKVHTSWTIRHFPRSVDITRNYLKITNTSPHNKYTLSAWKAR